ncbi:hypothetical protein J1N35_037246 [Gossypium stocksii]|uniref:Uncharacterized protein n=1 Tax=Gossypium stocksii TaxID=47602 RepID=A0A9D3UJM6_9ROSI|nr:hypothetical protein J1N35_037246 [Gossypium stocksii]
MILVENINSWKANQESSLAVHSYWQRRGLLTYPGTQHSSYSYPLLPTSVILDFEVLLAVICLCLDSTALIAVVI